MTDWISIVLLIFSGIALIIIELIFVPGTTILGILGLLALVGGVFISYTNFGSETGNWILIGTSVFSMLALVYSLRSGTWQKFALKSKMESKVNEHEKSELLVGMEGKTISDLRPVGTAEFLDKFFEVQTEGNYMEAGTSIKIANLSQNKIIVKSI